MKLSKVLTSNWSVCLSEFWSIFPPFSIPFRTLLTFVSNTAIQPARPSKNTPKFVSHYGKIDFEIFCGAVFATNFNSIQTFEPLLFNPFPFILVDQFFLFLSSRYIFSLLFVDYKTQCLEPIVYPPAQENISHWFMTKLKSHCYLEDLDVCS